MVASPPLPFVKAILGTNHLFSSGLFVQLERDRDDPNTVQTGWRSCRNVVLVAVCCGASAIEDGSWPCLPVKNSGTGCYISASPLPLGYFQHVLHLGEHRGHPFSFADQSTSLKSCVIGILVIPWYSSNSRLVVTNTSPHEFTSPISIVCASSISFWVRRV